MRVPWLKLTVLVVSFAALDALLSPRGISVFSRPEPMMWLVLYLALRSSAGTAMVVAWLAGLAKDVLSVGPIGGHALLLFGIAGVLFAIKRSLFCDHIFGHVALAFLASLAHDLAYWLCLLLWRPQISAAPVALPLLLRALLTAMFTPVAMALLARTRRWLPLLPTTA